MRFYHKLLIVFIFGISSCHSLDKKVEWIDFNWHGDSIGGKYYDRMSIIIPLKIDNLPYNFSAQFDLGASTSIYGKSISPYLKLNNQLAEKLDNKYYRNYHGLKCNSFQDITLYLDRIAFVKRSVIHFVNYGNSISKDSLLTPTPKRIGTIGLDLFLGKILIIDYPNKRIAVVDKLPNNINAFFVDMKLENQFIKIPFAINNKKEYLIFDSGNSNWELTTTKDNWLKIATTERSAIDSLEVTSWSRKIFVWWSKCKSDIVFADKTIPDVNVSFGSDSLIDDFLKREKVYGITGNRLFWNNVIVIDLIDNKFGIQK